MISLQRPVLVVATIAAFFVLVHILLKISPRFDSLREAASINARFISPEVGSSLSDRHSGFAASVKGRMGFQHPLTADKAQCDKSLDTSDVLIILKTGATELDAKLPVHFLTTFACAKDYLIFSDRSQSIGPHVIHDALSNISDQVKSSEQDFELYRKLHRQISLHGNLHNLADGSWGLDKWKFLPMISRAVDMYPNKKWFVLVEADTFLSWPNLLSWLARLDPRVPFYAGANVFMGGTEFAHGGSGVLLSGPAAEIVRYEYTDRKLEWDQQIAHECCGDKVLADVLKVHNVSVSRAFPMVQGETLQSLDWSRKHWCRPAVSWHHVQSADINRQWSFDQQWAATTNGKMPSLFRDVWRAVVRPLLVEERVEWDNLSAGLVVNASKLYTYYSAEEKASVGSKEACRERCAQEAECVQWHWETRYCGTSTVMRLGHSQPVKKVIETEDPDIGAVIMSPDRSTSGWMLERIEEMIKTWDECDAAHTWDLDV